MQGREQEVTLADLHHIAEEEQKAWFDEADSRQVGLCSASHHSACITAPAHGGFALCTYHVYISKESQSLYFRKHMQAQWVTSMS